MLDRIRKISTDRANKHVGLLAEFSDPGALYDAVKALRKKGYNRLDTFSPFPIHGMDAAMGLPVSKLGFLVFIGGATGAFLGWFLQWWASAGSQPTWLPTNLQGYAISVSNKPLFGLESSIPIMFELTILLSALTAVGGMLALNGLPKPYNPLFHSERFNRVTDDAFFLHIAEADGNFSAGDTSADLFGVGALSVEHITHDGATELDASGQPLAQPSADDGMPILLEPTASGDTPVTPSHTTGEI